LRFASSNCKTSCFNSSSNYRRRRQDLEKLAQQKGADRPRLDGMASPAEQPGSIEAMRREVIWINLEFFICSRTPGRVPGLAQAGGFRPESTAQASLLPRARIAEL
jgi:hypothetical protein